MVIIHLKWEMSEGQDSDFGRVSSVSRRLEYWVSQSMLEAEAGEREQTEETCLRWRLSWQLQLLAWEGPCKPLFSPLWLQSVSPHRLGRLLKWLSDTLTPQSNSSHMGPELWATITTAPLFIISYLLIASFAFLTVCTHCTVTAPVWGVTSGQECEVPVSINE